MADDVPKNMLKMRFRVTLSLLLLCLSIHINAQQRKRTTSQRQVTTTVQKPVQSTITKTRKVGEDGFIWYELKKYGLYGAADIEGRTIIPIKYTSINYYAYSCGRHFFLVRDNDFKGIYTRLGNCIIPTEKHFTKIEFDVAQNQNKKLFLGVACKNNNGQMAFFDIRGNEVIPLGDFEELQLTSCAEDALMGILYKKNGLWGLFDLNGNMLLQPRANAIVRLFENKIEIIDKIGDEYKNEIVWGSYSEDTRFDYNNYDRREFGIRIA